MSIAWVGSRLLVAGIAALALAACGGEGARPPATAAPAVDSAGGDAALIAAAQRLSDAAGGCEQIDARPRESKIVSLESVRIVMLACSGNEFAYTHRLFTAAQDGSLKMLPLPDYDQEGWFATDQASMAEIDAGAGVLTTLHAAGKKDCGSEGRYQWTGVRFALQELRWQSCEGSDLKGPPFPVIWPAMPASTVDPSSSTPAP